MANGKQLHDFSLEMTTPMSSVKNYIEAWKQGLNEKIIRRLQYIGVECVNEARNKGSYTNRTGNLRSSTGYVITHLGAIVDMSSFDPVKSTATEGSPTGIALATQLAGQIKGEWVLIVVAGMKYAKYVQNKGKDVLDSAQDVAEQMLKELGWAKQV